jgi:ribose transport system permease protein
MQQLPQAASLKERLAATSQEWLHAGVPLLVLVALLAIIEIGAPGFATIDTLTVMLADTAVLFILAAGVTFVILLGGIDLSIQAVASLASVVLAQLLPSWGLIAIPVAILAGIVSGAAGGFIHVRLRVPSFVSSLATGGVVGGLALLAAYGRAITIEEGGRQAVGWINQLLLGVPVVVIIAAIVGLASFLTLRYTPFGRHAVAVGAGEPAARAAGIDVNTTKIIAFTISGGLAALAGTILACRLSSGSPILANQLLLPAIAAVIVGGTAITGGLGGVARTAVGALIISIVRIGMTFVGVNIFAEQMVFGTVLIVAVAITIDRSKIPVIK